jgi:hypothetical protein
MIRSLRFLPLLALLALAACEDGGNDTPKATLTVTYRALYDGQPLEKYKNYPYGNRILFFDRFNTYLSDISLTQNGNPVRVKDIDWIDFTPDSATTNAAVEVVHRYEVPTGQYDGLSIGYGVKADLNAKRPTDFPPEHPLYLENEYWTGWKSYIFTKVQGRFDLNNDGTPEVNIFYHTGSDAAYATGQFPLSLSVDGPVELVVEIDLKDLMTFDGQLLDLDLDSNRTTSHSADNVALGVKVMQNLPNATTVKL